MNAEMRKNALRQYLVFRVKLIEFFDIGAVRQNLLRGNLSVPNPVDRKPSDFADSLRTPPAELVRASGGQERDGRDQALDRAVPEAQAGD